MNDSSWIRITATGNIPLREGRAIRLGTREIAVFNLGDRFLAIDNRCPHEGGPLCDGIVTGASVVCPLHAWKISLETGVVERPGTAAPCLRTYPARVEDGIVLLQIPRLADAAGEGAAA